MYVYFLLATSVNVIIQYLGGGESQGSLPLNETLVLEQESYKKCLKSDFSNVYNRFR